MCVCARCLGCLFALPRPAPVVSCCMRTMSFVFALPRPAPVVSC
jgi:hypothetical protein